MQIPFCKFLWVDIVTSFSRKVLHSFCSRTIQREIVRGEARHFYRDTETILLTYCATFLTSESSMCDAIVAIIIASISLSSYYRFLSAGRVAVLRLVNFAVSNVKSGAVTQIGERGFTVSQKEISSLRDNALDVVN